jgi:predicted enzyme related to lactoylglutathione lyase
LFFRARDPVALGRWYQEHFGITLTPSSYQELPWQQEAGPTVFSPFPETSDYFGNSRQWMVNFRVRDLDAMAAQLRAAGIAIDVDPKHYPNGRFARLHDLEGNPIELWQPEGPDAASGCPLRSRDPLRLHPRFSLEIQKRGWRVSQSRRNRRFAFTG